MSNVLLFREPSGIQDRYEQLFQQSSNYSAKSLPVLETVHCNIGSLSSRLLEEYEEFSGVIITSKRSCDALNESLQCSLGSDDLKERSKALGR